MFNTRIPTNRAAQHDASTLVSTRHQQDPVGNRAASRSLSPVDVISAPVAI